MMDSTPGVGTMLRLSRTFNVSRQKVFEAWTRPDNLRRWWGVAEGYTTPIAEVDLRVGGRYRLGMKAPGDGDLMVVGGVFKEVNPPSKLVYTWAWENTDPEGPGAIPETLVTLEFNEKGDATELVLTHEMFPDEESCRMHQMGWSGMLERLGPALESLE